MCSSLLYSISVRRSRFWTWRPWGHSGHGDQGVRQVLQYDCSNSKRLLLLILLVQTGKPTACLSSTTRNRVIDSGASNHIMDQVGIFYCFPPSSSLPCVTLANGSISTVKGIGVAQPIALGEHSFLWNLLLRCYYPMKIIRDNQTAQHIASNSPLHERTNHI